MLSFSLIKTPFFPIVITIHVFPHSKSAMVCPVVNSFLHIFSNSPLFTKKYEGQPLLLCSDGLYNSVNPNDIESIIRLDDLPQQKCDELVSLANANGGSDNIAIVYWEVLRYGD